MNASRLLALATFLETGLAGLHLTFARWGTPDGRSGCAVGLAAMHCAEFKVLGLRVENEVLIYEIPFTWFAGWNAIAAFFEIPLFDATRLFGYDGALYSYGPIEGETVARYVREYVETGKVPVPAPRMSVYTGSNVPKKKIIEVKPAEALAVVAGVPALDAELQVMVDQMFALASAPPVFVDPPPAKAELVEEAA
jgi:hypothetical protein